MIKSLATLTLAVLLLTISSVSSADGLSVSKYLEDPEHKDQVISFYLNAIFTGINLANSRLEKPLFCMSDASTDSPFARIDSKIQKLQQEKKLHEDMTIESIMMDILIDEFPCK
jgi:hypothetical protein